MINHPTTVLYHAGCADGFGAAWALHLTSAVWTISPSRQRAKPSVATKADAAKFDPGKVLMPECPPIEDPIAGYLARLVARGRIASVWLLGSRANGIARPDSDWDFLVFAEAEAFAALQSDESFRLPNIDLLVTVDRDAFQSPWPRLDGRPPKSGRLKPGIDRIDRIDGLELKIDDWGWRETSDRTAVYKGKRRCSVYTDDRNAFRVFPV
jgi:predicted nucleotidyltransferase